MADSLPGQCAALREGGGGASGGSPAICARTGWSACLRDSWGPGFHPLPEKRQQLFLGRLAMGLDPVSGEAQAKPAAAALTGEAGPSVAASRLRGTARGPGTASFAPPPACGGRLPIAGGWGGGTHFNAPTPPSPLRGTVSRASARLRGKGGRGSACPDASGRQGVALGLGDRQPCPQTVAPLSGRVQIMASGHGHSVGPGSAVSIAARSRVGHGQRLLAGPFQSIPASPRRAPGDKDLPASLARGLRRPWITPGRMVESNRRVARQEPRNCRNGAGAPRPGPRPG